MPPAVINPDCQPATFGSSRTRNQSISAMLGFLRATANAWVRYCACFVQDTPKWVSGGSVW